MSKKFIILIIIIIILSALFLGFSYLTKDNKSNSEQNNNTSENFFSNIFNFSNIAKNETINNVVDFITGDNNNEVKTVEIKKLNKVSSMPISGYGVLEKEIYTEVPDVNPNEVDLGEKPKAEAPKTEFISVLRYADKKNGNIYEKEINNNSQERKYSDTEIFRVHESFFTENNVVMRYLKNNDIIVTFLGEMPKDILGSDSDSNKEIFGSFLPDNIQDISISKNKKNIFYLSNSKNGVIGNLINEKGDKTQIFNSPFSEWNSYFINDDYIALNTRPSGIVKGFAYSLNTKTGDFVKLIDNINGLTTLINSDISTVLYADNNLSLKIFDTTRNETKNLKTKTHTEKCIWSNDNITLYCAVPKEITPGLLYPDSWYQGEASYNDEIWKIDTFTGAKTKIIDPNTLYENETIDAVNLSLDKDEKTLFFMNKVDSYLWALSLD